MSRRAARGKRSLERRLQESRQAQRRQLIIRGSWVTGLVVVFLGVLLGGIFYTGSRSQGEPELSPSTGLVRRPLRTNPGELDSGDRRYCPAPPVYPRGLWRRGVARRRRGLG